MSYNSNYTTRSSSGRYNNPGSFVAANPPAPNPPLPQQPARAARAAPVAQQPPPIPKQPATPAYNTTTPQSNTWASNTGADQWSDKTEKMETANVADTSAANGEKKPFWMKIKSGGIKKSTPAERRRKRNEQLRKRLTPKNALMVLNEMFPGEAVSNNFVVEPSGGGGSPYCAKLAIAGAEYKGFGNNKANARNAAAEQVFRDLIVKKMASLSGKVEESLEDEELPMVQLASFALHKLFEEWAQEGHQIPLLHKPAALSDSESMSGRTPGVPNPPKQPLKIKTELPANSSTMHPAMLLNYMRPGAEYHELGVEGEKAQSQVFTVGVTIDGHTYIGKASSKKEARKNAARTACTELFSAQFMDTTG